MSTKVKVGLLENSGNELSDEIFYNCSFCGKIIFLDEEYSKIHEKLSKETYCGFCLRNDYHTKIKSHTLIMSYRGLIGYYYKIYLYDRSVLVSQIQEHLINPHVEIGSKNPVLKYDPDTYCWFVDFSKIGRKRNQIPLSFVLNTLEQMCYCFDSNLIKKYQLNLYWRKMNEAVTKFHQKRYRPENRQILIPTIANIDGAEYMRNFLPKNLKVK